MDWRSFLQPESIDLPGHHTGDYSRLCTLSYSPRTCCQDNRRKYLQPLRRQGMKCDWNPDRCGDVRKRLDGHCRSLPNHVRFQCIFFNMVNGRGWICIALVVFASWHPGKALFGALLFAAFDAYQMRLQQVIGSEIPYQVFLMLPYLLSIVALILISRRVAIPQALMIPYRKGER